jgi:hypothetical protein
MTCALKRRYARSLARSRARSSNIGQSAREAHASREVQMTPLLRVLASGGLLLAGMGLVNTRRRKGRAAFGRSPSTAIGTKTFGSTNRDHRAADAGIGIQQITGGTHRSSSVSSRYAADQTNGPIAPHARMSASKNWRVGDPKMGSIPAVSHLYANH